MSYSFTIYGVCLCKLYTQAPRITNRIYSTKMGNSKAISNNINRIQDSPSSHIPIQLKLYDGARL